MQIVMKRLQPKSVWHIVVLGFMVVLIPMMISMIHGARTFEDQADLSERTLVEVVDMTRNRQLLEEQLRAMERSTRQFQLLGDPLLIKIFEGQHSRFLEATQSLGVVLGDHVKLNTLVPMEAQISQIDMVIHQKPVPQEELKSLIQNFSQLTGLAQMLWEETDARVNQHLKGTREQAMEAQGYLWLQFFSMMPATVLLVIVFTVLINAPVKQLDRAIHTLGDGNFTEPVAIKGPRDFRLLGQRLEWLRTKLADLEAQKQKFLRHMSHELKTPLASLREGVELLTDEIPGKLTAGQKEVVGIIEKNVHQFQHLIENLLDFNLVSGNSRIIKDDIAVPDFVKEVILSHKLIASTRNVSFACNGELLMIRADRGRLRTALDNLVSNAVNYSPTNGQVGISWRFEGDMLKLTVDDDGPGVAESDRQRIFIPFYQGAAQRQGPIKGSGIGLSVAAECVKAHKGQLEILPSTKSGSCFQMTIPIT